jgi:hypothetical protein
MKVFLKRGTESVYLMFDGETVVTFTGKTITYVKEWISKNLLNVEVEVI